MLILNASVEMRILMHSIAPWAISLGTTSPKFKERWAQFNLIEEI
jgi:hypothetical protein